MGLFAKYCAYCGRKVEKGQDVVRFGKHFDSEEHAELYTKKVQETQSSQSDDDCGGGCC